MLKCIGRNYYAVSNLFVQTCDGEYLTYPAPHGLILDVDSKDEKNNSLTVSVSSYYDSILMLDYVFSLFFYLMFFDGTIESFYLGSVFLKDEPRSEAYGYKAIYHFDPDLFVQNISLETCNFYDKLQNIKRQQFHQT